MRWYQFGEDEFHIFDNNRSAYQHAVVYRHSFKSIKAHKLTPYRPKEFYELLQNTLHHCDNQHSLQSALLQALGLREKDQRAKIILSQLQNGTSFGQALIPFTPPQLKALFATLRQSTSEGPKIAILKSAAQLLERELALSQQISKSLTYPFLIMQSALLMAFMNAVFNQLHIVNIAILWSSVTILQVATLYFTLKGTISQLITKHITGIRIGSVLTLTLSMLESGESLQNTIELLKNHAHIKDRHSLYKAHLLLKSGYAPENCIPQQWFTSSGEKTINLKQTADIVTPLIKARDDWQRRNQQQINLICKAIPILGIVLSSIFVAYTLIQLYLPLLELSNFAV
ncbi:hypothetical protein DN730_03380 [Marinomonas piezotolerans]|uniref:Type II secretion system protein GspF domain-containing protein n=1 Tax=Marinomonas piezotolerans TaxID=2213058 RepID=A0A370UE86_9GAMM|nr:type II secretion system F family protein [Marinomonas piezotolerans]RDL46093.1 hypothetical protein DN730_03380 [Marinomonas piezotolerans]